MPDTYGRYLPTDEQKRIVDDFLAWNSELAQRAISQLESLTFDQLPPFVIANTTYWKHVFATIKWMAHNNLSRRSIDQDGETKKRTRSTATTRRIAAVSGPLGADNVQRQNAGATIVERSDIVSRIPRPKRQPRGDRSGAVSGSKRGTGRRKSN